MAKLTRFASMWGDKKGELLSVSLDGRRLGHRVTALVLEGSDTVTVQEVRGDGRRKDFVVYRSEDVPADSVERTIAKMAEVRGYFVE